MLTPPTPSQADPLELTAEERSRVLSSTRLKAVLTGFVGSVVIALSLLMMLLVGQIFAVLTPATRADLVWKAERGAAELANEATLALVTADADEIARASRDFVRDPDVVAIVGINADGQTVFTHGVPPVGSSQLFAGEPRSARDVTGHFVTWADARIEGASVGRVALVISQARLAAGDELRTRVLFSGALGCGLALLVSLGFVHFYVGPLVRLSDAAFQRLEQRTYEALEATRLKGEFLANMSHEIRTPMNGIVGMAELLGRTQLDSRQRLLFKSLTRSSESLMGLLNDVLDMSKIDAGALKTKVVRFDLPALLDDVAEQIASLAHRKGVDVSVSLEPSVPRFVDGDPERVRQVLVNFASNAVKFTEQGDIMLSARPSDGGVELAVSDTGMGISTADQAHLYEAFWQADGSSTRAHGGTGLGLPISKKLTELMGGTVGVESEYGTGSKFWLTLPLPASDEARQDIPALASSPVVWVVMPESTSRELLAARLAQHGARVTVVGSPAEALEVLASSVVPGGISSTRSSTAKPSRSACVLQATPSCSSCFVYDESTSALPSGSTPRWPCPYGAAKSCAC